MTNAPCTLLLLLVLVMVISLLRLFTYERVYIFAATLIFIERATIVDGRDLMYPPSPQGS